MVFPRVIRSNLLMPATPQLMTPRPTLLRPLTALVFGLTAALAAFAQPSGGPYGPVQRNYDLPTAKRIFYVAPDGAVDAAGTSLDKPTTIDNAIAQVTTGDAIVLRGGTYRTGGLRVNQGITMQPYAGELPVFKGTEVASQWTAQRNGLWRTTWTKLFPAQPADWWNRAGNARRSPLHLFNNDMVFLDGRQLNAVGGEHEVDENSYFIDYEDGLIFLGTNPEGHVVEVTAHDSALVRTIRDVHGKTNDRKGPVIRGITFTQYAYRALEVEGIEPMKYTDPANFGKEVTGTVLEDLTISFCSRVAGYFRGDNLVIRHCLVSDCGTEGIYVINSADILLERNIVTRTNSAEELSGYFASAVKIFNQSYRAVCRDNLIIDNPHASGVWYDVGEVDGVFVNNWVENTQNGFFFEISKGAICAGNVFVECDPGIRILNSSGVEVYQNTFFNSAASFMRNERSAVGDHFGWHPSAGPEVEERHSHVAVNNLFVGDETDPDALLQFGQAPGLRERLRDPQVSTLDGNVYVRRTGAKPSAFITWNPASTENGVASLRSLDEFHALEPRFEKHARFFSDYRGPLFRGAELGHFELLRTFPGASTGVPLPEKIRALLNWKKSDTAFPGAYAPR